MVSEDFVEFRRPDGLFIILSTGKLESASSLDNVVQLELRGPLNEEGVFYYWAMYLAGGAEFKDGSKLKTGVWDPTLEREKYLPNHNLKNTTGRYGVLRVLPIVLSHN